MHVQVFILDALSTYPCQELREAEMIAERVMPRLQHVNSAVVLSAIKVSACPPHPFLSTCAQGPPPLMRVVPAPLPGKARSPCSTFGAHIES